MAKIDLTEANINDKEDQELLNYFVACSLGIKELEESKKVDDKVKEMQEYVKLNYSEPVAALRKRLKLCTFVLRRRSIPLPSIEGVNS